jgi:hypothetical protein
MGDTADAPTDLSTQEVPCQGGTGTNSGIGDSSR